jgi:hypothetical protein
VPDNNRPAAAVAEQKALQGERLDGVNEFTVNGNVDLFTVAFLIFTCANSPARCRR